MIDSDAKLAEFLPTLSAADWVALDTEADSLHAYPEKLCLIQISLASGDFLIDPLARIDLGVLWPELKKHQLILHGADYDLRLFRKNHGFVPTRIFDTMLASRLLGDREFGLTHLVKKYLDVTLEKGSQKADWARRPLTERMAAYARNDTHYLKRLSDILREQLAAKNRVGWLEESCDRLITECAIPASPEPDLVWRVKGSHRLAPGGLAVLRELWHWREKEAVTCNKPPYFILTHEALVEIATAVIEHREFAKFLPRHFSPRRQEGLKKAIAASLALLPEQQPQVLRLNPRRQTDAERRRFEELETRRNRRATELGLDPTLIGSRATLASLACDWSGHKDDLMGWQRELLEKEKEPQAV